MDRNLECTFDLDAVIRIERAFLPASARASSMDTPFDLVTGI